MKSRNTPSELISRIEIIDQAGRVVKGVRIIGALDAEINVSDVSPGIYFLCVTWQKGGSIMKKIAIR